LADSRSLSRVLQRLLCRKLTLKVKAPAAIADPKETLNYNKKFLPVLADILQFRTNKKRSNPLHSALAAGGMTRTRNNTGKHPLA